MNQNNEPNLKNPFLDFSSIFWLIAELFIAGFLCFIPILKNGILNEHTLTQGMISAGIFLILSEFFRRFFRQLWQPFFLLTFFILLIFVSPILCAIFFLIYLLFQAKQNGIFNIFVPITIVKSKETDILSSSIASTIIFTFIALSFLVSALYGVIISDFGLLDKLVGLTQIPLGIVITYYFGTRYFQSH